MTQTDAKAVIDIPDRASAVELTWMLFARKFFSADTVAQMSPVVNDTIRACIAEWPDIPPEFDGYGNEIVRAFEKECDRDDDLNLWQYIQSLGSDAEKTQAIEAFFLPLLKKSPFNPSNRKEIVDAYRGR